MLRVTFCVDHFYSGVFPCPWPECSNGLPTHSFDHLGKHISRERFDGPTGAPAYAWVIDGIAAPYVAAQLSRRAILEVNVAPTLDDDGYMYHFTSAEGLRAIIQSRELWLTDYRDLADAGEIRDSVEIAATIFGQLGPQLHDTTRELLWALIHAPLPEGVYVACFCMLRDSPHHWQEYAKDSTGGALMLNPFGFGGLLESDPFAIQFTRVVYSWDAKERLFLEMACRLDSLVRFDVRRGLFNRDAYVREMQHLLAELLPMCKDVSYLKEHELRIVVTPARSRFDLETRLNVHSIKGRRYITTREVLPGFDLPVEEVVVGPTFVGETDTFPNEGLSVRRA
jgi:hypothetical protein